MNSAYDPEYQTPYQHGVVTLVWLTLTVVCADPARKGGDCGVGNRTSCVTAGCAGSRLMEEYNVRDIAIWTADRYGSSLCGPMCCRAVKSCKKICDGRRWRVVSVW
jgi:hypothetical protein